MIELDVSDNKNISTPQVLITMCYSKLKSKLKLICIYIYTKTDNLSYFFSCGGGGGCFDSYTMYVNIIQILRMMQTIYKCLQDLHIFPGNLIRMEWKLQSLIDSQGTNVEQQSENFLELSTQNLHMLSELVFKFAERQVLLNSLRPSYAYMHQ